MAQKEFTLDIRTRQAKPRSKRLRDLGAAATGGGSTVVQVNGGGEATGPDHHHENLSVLDKLSLTDGYLMIDALVEVEDEDGNPVWQKTRLKVNAGNADNSQKWALHEFGDWLDQPVRHDDIVTFAKVVSAIISSPDFAQGIETGSGWGIDGSGHGEMNSLTLRSTLKVPMLIYNKIRVTGGEMWNTEGGTIKTVERDPDSDSAYILTMDLEDGDTIELAVGDICKGQYNYNAGLVTSYFRVTHVNQTAGTVRVVLGADSVVPGGENHEPVPFMNVARYGSFTDEERQRSQYFSSAEGRITMLSGVDQYIITPSNYAVIIGDLPDALIPDDLPQLHGRPSIYLENVLTRNLIQLDHSGTIIKTIRDRGRWSSTVATQDPYLCNSEYQDECWHKSCKYRCIVEGTEEEPSFGSTDWLLVSGDTSLTLDIDSVAGSTFLYGHLDTTLIATVRRGVNDISDDILDSDWSWTRDTGDTASDRIWNTDHAECTRELELSNEDLPVASGCFICTVYVRDGVTTEPLTAYVRF